MAPNLFLPYNNMSELNDFAEFQKIPVSMLFYLYLQFTYPFICFYLPFLHLLV